MLIFLRIFFLNPRKMKRTLDQSEEGSVDSESKRGCYHIQNKSVRDSTFRDQISRRPHECRRPTQLQPFTLKNAAWLQEQPPTWAPRPTTEAPQKPEETERVGTTQANQLSRDTALLPQSAALRNAVTQAIPTL